LELYLQLGFGMMNICKRLVRGWGGGTVILSPRDLEYHQLLRFAEDLVTIGGATLFDPQFFLPRATHSRLRSHDYFPDDYDTSMLSGGPALDAMLRRIAEYNDELLTSAHIIPAIQCPGAQQDWFAIQETVLEQGDRHFTGKPKLLTVCLAPDVLRYEREVEDLLARTEDWNVDGYYVVAEHQARDYLVDVPVWLANLLNLCAGFKLQGRKVIVGYGSHQLISLAAAGTDGLGSGNWLNVRHFDPARFDQNEEALRRHGSWCYCPQAMSEFQVRFLDIAHQRGILDELRPDESLHCEYCETLFSGALPSDTGYGRTDSFLHYLQCLRGQVEQATKVGYRATYDAQIDSLSRARETLEFSHEHGVYGQQRDFTDLIDVSQSALQQLDHARGFLLEGTW
jgi:hypothetical protein